MAASCHERLEVDACGPAVEGRVDRLGEAPTLRAGERRDLKTALCQQRRAAAVLHDGAEPETAARGSEPRRCLPAGCGGHEVGVLRADLQRRSRHRAEQGWVGGDAQRRSGPGARSSPPSRSGTARTTGQGRRAPGPLPPRPPGTVVLRRRAPTRRCSSSWRQYRPACPRPLSVPHGRVLRVGGRGRRGVPGHPLTPGRVEMFADDVALNDVHVGQRRTARPSDAGLRTGGRSDCTAPAGIRLLRARACCVLRVGRTPLGVPDVAVWSPRRVPATVGPPRGSGGNPQLAGPRHVGNLHVATPPQVPTPALPRADTSADRPTSPSREVSACGRPVANLRCAARGSPATQPTLDGHDPAEPTPAAAGSCPSPVRQQPAATRSCVGPGRRGPARRTVRLPVRGPAGRSRSGPGRPTGTGRLGGRRW